MLHSFGSECVLLYEAEAEAVKGEREAKKKEHCAQTATTPSNPIGEKSIFVRICIGSFRIPFWARAALGTHTTTHNHKCIYFFSFLTRSDRDSYPSRSMRSGVLTIGPVIGLRFFTNPHFRPYDSQQFRKRCGMATGLKISPRLTGALLNQRLLPDTCENVRLASHRSPMRIYVDSEFFFWFLLRNFLLAGFK